MLLDKKKIHSDINCLFDSANEKKKPQGLLCYAPNVNPDFTKSIPKTGTHNVELNTHDLQLTTHSYFNDFTGLVRAVFNE